MACDNGGEEEFCEAAVHEVLAQWKRDVCRGFDELQQLMDRHHANFVAFANEGKRRMASLRERAAKQKAESVHQAD